MLIDQHLNWNGLILMITQKNSKSSVALYRIRNTLDIKSKGQIYNIASFIHTLLAVQTSGRLHIEIIQKNYVLHKSDPYAHYLRLHVNRFRRILS